MRRHAAKVSVTGHGIRANTLPDATSLSSHGEVSMPELERLTVAGRYRFFCGEELGEIEITGRESRKGDTA